MSSLKIDEKRAAMGYDSLEDGIGNVVLVSSASVALELAGAVDCPVVAEGRYATPDQVRAAFDAGAWAVVVGTAITDPGALTARLAAATPGSGVPDGR